MVRFAAKAGILSGGANFRFLISNNFQGEVSTNMQMPLVSSFKRQ